MRCFNRQFSFSTQPLRPLPLPSRGETHLWYVIPDEIKSSSLLNRYLEILSPCEKQSVLSFPEDELRKKALLARALVRTTISRYQTNSYVNPSSLMFKKNSYGKPEVDWQQEPDRSSPPLHFNLSHSSSLIACGITAHSPIGIDVEDKTRKTKNSVISFARRFFSPHEVEHLANIYDPEMQQQEFLKLWTLKSEETGFFHVINQDMLRLIGGRGLVLMQLIKGKLQMHLSKYTLYEAYVKALGRGFSATPFKTFRIHIKASSNNMSNIPDVADPKESEIAVESTQFSTGQWQFALIELADTHYAAICTENDSLNNGNSSPMALKVWKTIPFLEDLCMSGSRSVVTVGGLVKQLSFKEGLKSC